MRQSHPLEIEGVAFLIIGDADGWSVYVGGFCVCFGIRSRSDAENYCHANRRHFA